MPHIFFAPALDLMMQIARSYKLDPIPLLEASGINPAAVTDPNKRIPYDRVLAFYDRVAELIPDPNFGLKCEELWHPTQMGALGYAWMTSSTLRTALERLVRFIKIISGYSSLELKETRSSLSLVIHPPSEKVVAAFRIDGAMAILLAMVQSNAGEAFHPKSVKIAHPEPKNAGPFYSLFQCPIDFGARSNSFTISTADADAPRSCSNAQLALLHDQLLIKYLADLKKENVVERTKAAIIDNLPSGNISDAIVAQSLQMSERTLQRRLHEFGTTFKSILNEVREDLANTYIRDSKLTLTKISFMLGFAEISTFSRAFKRWTGQPPSAFRGNIS
jgi:AraC-like DNA-binding protein